MKGVTLPDSFLRGALFPSLFSFSRDQPCLEAIWLGWPRTPLLISASGAFMLSFSTQTHISFALNPFPILKEAMVLLG